LAALPTAAFYGDDRLAPVMFVLAIGWIAAALQNIGIVDFRRNLEFRSEFKFLMAKRLIGTAVTIPLALATGSYWALIVGSISSTIAGALLSYLLHPFRPRPRLERTGALFSFSVWLLVEKLASFVNIRASDFIVGRVHGPAELGMYRLAEEIGSLAGTELVAPINRALLPGTSRLAEDGQSVANVVIAATGVMGLLAVPACVGIAAGAQPVVRVLLGHQWLAAIPVLEIMAISALFALLWANQFTMLYAIGMPRIPGTIAIARLFVFLPAVWGLVSDHGAWGVAVAAALANAAVLALGLRISLPLLGVTVRAYIGALWRPLVAAAIMAVAVRLAIERFGAVESSIDGLGQLAVAVGSGVTVYVLVLSILYFLSGRPSGAESLFMHRLTGIMNKVVSGS
jgi:O-antigen/teichoic acid export membrane protein